MALCSYALDSTQTNPRLRDTDYNHFVIFDPFNVIACHDFEVHLRHLTQAPHRDVSNLPPARMYSNCAGFGSFTQLRCP